MEAYLINKDRIVLVGVPTLSPETSLRQLNIRVVGRDPQSAENKKHNWANTVFPNRQTPN